MTRRHAITSGSADPSPGREPSLAVALARLEACATWRDADAAARDADAAARALDALAAGSPDGAWLLLQMAAAGLRALSTGTAHLPTPTVHTHPNAATAIVATPTGMTSTHTTCERTRW